MKSLVKYSKAACRRTLYKVKNAPDETRCRYISSWGIMKSCDVRYRIEGDTPPRQLSQLTSSDESRFPSIYVRTKYLERFVQECLDDIDVPFTLVTGDCDVEVSERDISAQTIQRVLGRSKVRTWFAQNCNTVHDKIQPMPLGLDYHTLTLQEKHFPWGYFKTPLRQEQVLDDARMSAPRLGEKKLSAYCNWQHVLKRGDRLQCIRSVQPEVMHLEDANLGRDLCWHNNAGHLYTISPLGSGLDCHRTWEALLLGSVPIVPRSGICSLFESLPVCIVDDWQEVTIGYLKDRREWILESEFDFGPLYLEWWKARILGEKELPSRRQRFQDFVDGANQPAC